MAGKNMSSQRSVWWILPAGLAAVVLLAAAAYAAYVFLSYSRIEDNVELEVTGDARSPVQTGREYTAVSYNIGFGAYTADFTFFMDGGKESRAHSKESVLDCVNGTSGTALSFGPDIALFQEVDTDSTRSHHVNECQLIVDNFSEEGAWDSVFAQNYHSAYLMYPLSQPHGKSNSGILTLSRMDITSSLRRSLPIASGFKKIIDLDRCYSICRLPVENGKELVVFNAHLSAYGTDATSGEYFNPQSTESFSWCAPFPDDMIPDGFTKCTGYAEEFMHTSRYTDRPYSGDSLVFILDGFILSDNIDCTYVQNIDTGYQYTDHNPVVLKFILKDH